MSEFLRKMLADAKLKADKIDQKNELPEDAKNIPDIIYESDMDTGPDRTTISDIVLVSDIGTESDTSAKTDTAITPDTENIPARQRKQPIYYIVPFKVKKKLPKLPPSGYLLYVYLHKLAFRKKNSSGIIEYNQREIMTQLDFQSPSTIVGAMAALERNNLISWEEKSHKRGIRSKLKVTPMPELLGTRRTLPDTDTVSDH